MSLRELSRPSEAAQLTGASYHRRVADGQLLLARQSCLASEPVPKGSQVGGDVVHDDPLAVVSELRFSWPDCASVTPSRFPESDVVYSMFAAPSPRARHPPLNLFRPSEVQFLLPPIVVPQLGRADTGLG